MKTLWLADRLSKRNVGRETDDYLRRLAQAPLEASRLGATKLLTELQSEPGPHVHLGETRWGEPVVVPLGWLVRGCGLTTGGTGAGKTMFALHPIEAMVRLLPGMRHLGFGVLDAKGELFERTLFLLARRLGELRGEAQAALLRRIVIVDFSNRDTVSPYNILARWPYAETDYFITSRLETLRELLPAGEKLSLRGAAVLRNVLLLLSEFSLPLTYLGTVLSSEEVRRKLVSRSQNDEVRAYFRHHFAAEGKQTIAALRVRMESLLAADGVRLALTGSTAPDFRELQNEGKIVLVNCSGPTITRGVRLLLQGLILSDIRQAIFARPNQPPVSYLWCADEAQNFFLTRQQQENMADILTMARSFGSYFYFLCQNLMTAVPDTRTLEILYTNIRWSMTMRSTPRDAGFLRSALPATGRRKRPAGNPFEPPRGYSPEEERSLALEEIAHLPDREGYLWLKARSAEAIRLRTRAVEIPEGEAFREIVEWARQEPRLGGRLARPDYERLIEARDREWLGRDEGPSDIEARMERAWRAQELNT